ncbi:MAG: 4Fe-4S binding protein [Bacteroidales bacterium]|nr:4Fe-4S binding protein [Bacteroidales bacterium]
MKHLKLIRRIAASLFFVPILLSFLDFTGKLPEQLHVLIHLQWMPSLLTLSFGSLLFLVLLSLVLGRLYCSVICPLGVMQDIASWKSTWFPTRKRKRYSYAKPRNFLRYSILTLTVITFFSGSSLLVMILDPYSIFGRLTTQLFRPLVIAANNLLVVPLSHIGIYSLYKVEQLPFVPLMFTISIIFFIAVAVMSWFWGRMYCNTICPVGTFLGIFSKFSLFKIEIEQSSCTQCSACETKCKSQCIDSQAMTVDDSRCVSCFNCLSVCKKGGVKYAFRYAKNQVNKKTVAFSEKTDLHKRTFLMTSGAVLVGAVTAKTRVIQGAQDSYLTRKPIMPPGAFDAAHFHQHCTGCQLCVAKCPMQVLKPAALQYGWLGIMQPHLAFSTHVYCNYECTVCTDICPTAALKPLTVTQKKVAQIGVAKFRKNICIVFSENKDCGACSEHCPTQAVHMIPFQNGLTIPEVTEDLCIGCGGCESICPVTPRQAIYVEGLGVQAVAKKPSEAKKFEKKIEDFGF